MSIVKSVILIGLIILFSYRIGYRRAARAAWLIFENRGKCDTCARHGTMECPNSSLCYSTETRPFWKGEEK